MQNVNGKLVAQFLVIKLAHLRSTVSLGLWCPNYSPSKKHIPMHVGLAHKRHASQLQRVSS